MSAHTHDPRLTPAWRRAARAWLAVGTATVLASLGGAATAAVTVAAVSAPPASSSKVSSLTVAAPSGLAAGQLMVASVATYANVSTAPSGWTLQRTVTTTSSMSLRIYTRRVANPSAEPASYTWALSSSERGAATIVAFDGVDPTVDVEVTAGQANAASTTFTAPSVTTTSTGALMVAVFAADAGNTSANTPTGMSAAYPYVSTNSGPNGVALGMAIETRALAGPTGSRSSSGNGSAQSAGITLSIRANPNVSAVDHYELTAPSSAVACLGATITVTACRGTARPCTDPVTTMAGQTVTLGASAGTLVPATVVLDGSGRGTASFQHPAAADGSSVTVSLASLPAAASNGSFCCPDGVACSAGSSCTVTMNTAGLVVAAAANGAPVVPATQTGGSASASHVLRAIRTSTSTQACEAALTGSQSIDWAYACDNPSTCSSGNRLFVPTAAAAANPAGAPSSWLPVPLVFDAQGNAPFSFRYDDVGRIVMHMRKLPGGTLLTTLTGNSGAFVVRPAGFTLSGIRCTSTGAGACAVAAPGNNPGATDATGPAFIPAGAAFTATVTATLTGGAAAANYGRESPAAGVVLAASLVQPAGGAAPPLGNAQAFGGFSGGSATGTTFAWPEVGILTLTPSVSGGSYLGTGNVTGSASGPVGRFVPARFALSGTSVTHRANLACSPASTFSYLGENFRLAMTLTAQATTGATTTNYAGAFAKFDPASVAAWNLAGRDGATLFNTGSGRLALVGASGSFTAGVAANAVLTASASRAAAPDGPFNAAFGVAPVDSDGVALASYDLDTDAVPGNDRASVGTLPLAFGRLTLASAIGAADRVLALPVAAQSWNGSAFADHAADSCTTVPVAALNFGNLRRTITVADTAASGPIVIGAGRGTLRLAAPGGGRSGTYDVALSLGTAATDASCLQPWTPGAGDAATLGANLGYLRGAWCGAAFDRDPSARATFGLPRGHDAWIYRRENY